MRPDLVVAFAVSLANLKTQFPNVTFISTEEAAGILDGRCRGHGDLGGPALIDVRTPAEYLASHLPGAVRVFVDAPACTLADAYDAFALPNRSHVVVYCTSGKRAAQFAGRLMELTEERLSQGLPTGPAPLVIAGSSAKWAGEGRPLVTGDGWPETRVYIAPTSPSIRLVDPELLIGDEELPNLKGGDGNRTCVQDGTSGGRPDVTASVEPTRPGACPDLPAVASFNLTAYLGLWYEIQRYPTNFQVGVRCVTAEYALLPDSGRIQVNNSAWDEKTKTYFSVEGEAYAEDPTLGDLKVRFSPAQPTYGMYRILDTDYSGHSLVWSCRPLPDSGIGPANAQSLWILAREPELSRDRVDGLRQRIGDEFGLGLEELMPSSREGC